MSQDWRQRSFDLVVEITKQVLTLAVALITVSIAFLKDLTVLAAPARQVMATSWILLLLAVVFGLMTLMACAGVQDKAAARGVQPSITESNIRALGGAQLVLFLLGLVLAVAAGLLSVIR